MKNVLVRVAGFVLVSNLVACGGGGGGSTSTPTAAAIAPATTNVLAAYQSLVRQPHTFSLSGSTSTGVSLTATLSVAQGAQITSNGKTYDTSTVTVSIYSGGVLQATGVTNTWQDVGTPNWAISYSTLEGSCVLRTGGSALPTSAALNATGAYLTGAEYSGCNPSNQPMSFWISTGTVAQTWAYQVYDGIPFVCLNSSTQGFVGTSTESDCVEIVDANGTLGPRARVTTKDLNGVTTTLTN